ncbi:MAG: hypothetical protein HY738_08945 [Bacteroidia bacterium]|nr:hypothetical protein [Bacteroidia bacterium]
MKTLIKFSALYLLIQSGNLTYSQNILLSDDASATPGTAATDGLLQVKKTLNSGYALIDIHNYTALAADVNTEIAFKTGGVTASTIYFTGLIKTIGTAADAARMGFFTGTTTDRTLTLTERLTILNGGNVGIGVTNPLYSLDISGSARVQGNEIYGGASGQFYLYNNGSIRMDLDNDNNGTESFKIVNGSNLIQFEVTEAGNVDAEGNADFNGNLTLSGSAARTMRGPVGAVTDYPLNINSASGLDLTIDDDNDGTGSAFRILKDAGTAMFRIAEDGSAMFYPYGIAAGETGAIRLLELTVNGTNYTGFKAPDILGSDYMYTLPATDGSNGNFLKTNGTGGLSWSTIGGGIVNCATAGRILKSDGTDAVCTVTPVYEDAVNSRIGIGTSTPNEQLEITGSFRIPVTTASNGIIKMDANPYIHSFGGTSNFFAGVNAGNLTLTSSNNTGIGYQALLSSTSGISNTAVGYNSLYSNTDGAGNFAGGYQSMYYAQSLNNYNVAIGYNSMYGPGVVYSGAVDNIAIGRSTLYSISGGTGDYNIGMGYESQYSITTGNDNISFGRQALYSNSSGIYNIGVGYMTIYNGTTDNDYNVALGYGAMMGSAAYVNADNNVAIGREALYNMGDGNSNVALGYKSGYSTSSGLDNVSIGTNALYSNTTGTYNIAAGNNALYYGTGLNDVNIALGFLAMEGTGAYTDTDHNIAIGRETLHNISGGDFNIGVGYKSGYSTTTGEYNISIGTNALYSNSTGTFNIGAGYGTLYYATTSNDFNIALGLDAMKGSIDYINTDYNIAIGRAALYSINDGDHNIALGYGAGDAITSGTYNIAIGRDAVGANTTVSGLVGIGYNALAANVTGGAGNTAVGYTAGDAITDGDYNTALGYDALGASTTASGQTAIGYNSLLLATGAENMGLGYAAGDNISTGTNNIIIGYDVDAPVAANSNQLSIGNLIFATGGFGTGTAIGAGNVGIKTNAPAYPLDVNGAIRTGYPGLDGQLRIYSEQGATDYEVIVNPNAAMTQDITLTLPADDGSDGQVLKTDGSGNLSWSSIVYTIPLWQDDLYLMNNTSGQDLSNCESGFEPAIIDPDGQVQVKLIIRAPSVTSGTTNFQLRAHNGTIQSYPILNTDSWTVAATQTGKVFTSPWKDWDAGSVAWEIHLNGWVSDNNCQFNSAYLLVRPKP